MGNRIEPGFAFSDFLPEVITLDGPSAVGKGTLCRLIGEEISRTVPSEKVRILDAGHTYRMLTHYFLNVNTIPPDELLMMGQSLEFFLKEKVRISFDGISYLLNDTDVKGIELKSHEIDKSVARYAGIDEVKMHIVEAQRGFLKNSPDTWWLLDGRCMGTAVAPDALIKAYVDADPRIKAGWRYAQYSARGEAISAEKVYEELVLRDRRDIEARVHPLAVPDACFFIWSHKGNPNYNARLIIDYAASQLLLKGSKA